MLLSGGVTIDNSFQLAVTDDEPHIRVNEDGDQVQRPLLQDTNLIILDENSMVNGTELDCCVDSLAIVGFAGAHHLLLFTGNDPQTSPVVQGATGEVVSTLHVTNSRTYRAAKHFTVYKNMRVHDTISGLKYASCVYKSDTLS